MEDKVKRASEKKEKERKRWIKQNLHVPLSRARRGAGNVRAS